MLYFNVYPGFLFVLGLINLAPENSTLLIGSHFVNNGKWMMRDLPPNSILHKQKNCKNEVISFVKKMMECPRKLAVNHVKFFDQVEHFFSCKFAGN